MRAPAFTSTACEHHSGILSIVIKKNGTTFCSFRKQGGKHSPPAFPIGYEFLDTRVVYVHMYEIFRHMETVLFSTLAAHGSFRAAVGVVNVTTPNLRQVLPGFFGKALPAHNKTLDARSLRV